MSALSRNLAKEHNGSFGNLTSGELPARRPQSGLCCATRPDWLLLRSLAYYCGGFGTALHYPHALAVVDSSQAKCFRQATQTDCQWWSLVDDVLLVGHKHDPRAFPMCQQPKQFAHFAKFSWRCVLAWWTTSHDDHCRLGGS